jgi:hypothetical protein
LGKKKKKEAWTKGWDYWMPQQDLAKWTRLLKN